MLLEADPETVASRAQVRNDADIPLGDQTITQVRELIYRDRLLLCLFFSERKPSPGVPITLKAKAQFRT